MDKSLVVEDNTFYGRHRFMAMVTLSIMVASALVAISMTLYYSSGAAQLDLSRPGYKDVRAKVNSNDNFRDYPGSGPINLAAITEFESLYNQKTKEIESVDAFGGDPLSPDALGLNVVVPVQ